MEKARLSRAKVFNDAVHGALACCMVNHGIGTSLRSCGSLTLWVGGCVVPRTRNAGHIELHPLCCRIVDTPEFQRLRHLKQLGGLYFVFPTASHNRFEHSIGVCHFAGLLIDHLERRQPYLQITPTEKLCVRIAGLIHDLGHGPLSHMFDEHVVRRLNEDSTWCHEDASIQMLDFMLSKGLRSEFERWGIGEREIGWIRAMILGTPPEDTHDRHFLFEIVANKRNGVDVDRMDYFARDCQQTGLQKSFDASRLLLFTRACHVEGEGEDRTGELHLAFKRTEAVNLLEFAHTRFMLHKRAYQHRVSRSVELLLTDVLVLAADHVPVRLPEDEKNRFPAKVVPLAKCHEDMRAYARLTDALLWERIAHSHEPELKESRALLDRLFTRKLYDCVAEMVLPAATAETGAAGDAGASKRSPAVQKWEEEVNQYRMRHGKLDSNKLLNRLCDIAEEHLGLSVQREPNQPAAELSRSDLLIDTAKLHFGMGEADPMQHMDFYKFDPHDVSVPESEVSVAPTAGSPPSARRLPLDQVSRAQPMEFQEEWLRVFCRSEDSKQRTQWAKVLQIWSQETEARDRLHTPLRATSHSVDDDGEQYHRSTAATAGTRARRRLDIPATVHEDGVDHEEAEEADHDEPPVKRARNGRSSHRNPLRSPDGPQGDGAVG